MLQLIDTHAHIFGEQFSEDLDAVIARSKQEGVARVYLPNIDEDSAEHMLEVERKYPGFCVPMIGIHPCHVEERYLEQVAWVEEWLKKRAFAAVGEIGMDLYWDKSTQKIQTEALGLQVKQAKKYGLPVVIHCRDSFEETYRLLKEHKDEKLTGVFHCFTGGVEEAEKAAELDFYLGLGGVSTFKNGGMDKVIPHLPLDRIVLETDSPYLAPVPFRGKRNEPSYLAHIAQRVADLREMSVEKLGELTTENAKRLFKDAGF